MDWNISHNPRMCHDLDTRLYLQGQGQSTHMFTNLCPGHNSWGPCCIWIFHTSLVQDKRVCHITLYVISPRSRSQCTLIHNLYQGHTSLLPCWIWIIFHTIFVHDQWMCHDLDPRLYLQGHCHRAHSQNLGLDHKYLLPMSSCRFHTIAVHDPRVNHDLDSRLYFIGQGHSAQDTKVYWGHNLLHVGSGEYFTQLLSMTPRCVMTLTQGHISNIKVTFHT